MKWLPPNSFRSETSGSPIGASASLELPPLLLLNHLVATLDAWDPLVTNGLAHEREVILFDNAGVGGSTGETPPTVTRIRQPALVVHGNKDIVVTPINAFILAQHLPDAQLVMYPDASHGAQSQHAGVFLEHARVFLNG
jgi:pimeloyl-ACP methyl ester carboxylesterase